MFSDAGAAMEAAAAGDPVIYEFFELGAPEDPGDLAFGTSITYPGKIGKEYYMTKGHFHRPIDTAEVYYALSGEGFMLMENPEGDSAIRPFFPGTAVYVPKRYAHRSINTGAAPLITFFVFRADAGHDYASIETKGFRKLVIEGGDGKPRVVDNPKWKP
jgi:glucose-6-phosphate isomerase